MHGCQPGNFDSNPALVRQFAKQYGGGQLPQGESDAIVLLAALAEVEGDVRHIRDLLMSPINPRTAPSTAVMFVLAERHGFTDELHQARAEHQSAADTDPS